MHVLATAGHVDHGKSALLRALTGMEPDRWDEERRRGLTIDLGFVWATIGGREFAFVDVPGHRRYGVNALAGLGPAPAVLFVVAADEGWMPQSAEHLAACEAFGVERGILAVTKNDRADPGPALAEARKRLAAARWRDVTAVAVSAHTGAGLDELRAALGNLAAELPIPDPAAPVRLWIDRRFTMRGAGTVVTGTLTAGTVGVGDAVEISGTRCAVRSVQVLGARVDRATAATRVAVNLRGIGREAVSRGDALLSIGAARPVTIVDVRVSDAAESSPRDVVPTVGTAHTAERLLSPAGALPREVLVHVGTACVAAHVRPLGADHARLTLRRPLPLWVGDRLALRDGMVVVAGATVLDVAPPGLNRRGSARTRADDLAQYPARPDAGLLLARAGAMRADDLRAMGLNAPDAVDIAGWLTTPETLTNLRAELRSLVGSGAVEASDAVRALSLPDPRWLPYLIEPPLTLHAGLVTAAAQGVDPDTDRILHDLGARAAATGGFQALADEEVALGPREKARAEQAGRLVRLAPGLLALPDSLDRAFAALAALPQPFTVSQARTALGTTRRIAIPLLGHLARSGLTHRTAEGSHQVTASALPPQKSAHRTRDVT